LAQSANKQQGSIADKSIILTISSLTSKVISLVATMIITRMLDETAYGTYKQTFLAINVALPFLAFGLTQGIFYFLPFEKERVRGRVHDCYVILLTSGVAFSAFILLGGNVLLAQRFNNPDVAPLLKLIVPYVITIVLTQCSAAIFNLMNRVRLYMVYTICSGLLTNVVLIIAILLAPTAKSAVLAMVVTKTAEGIFLIGLTSKILPKDSSRPSFSAMKEIIKFSIPMGVAGMISTFSTQLDSLFVTAMSEPKDFAVYTVGAHEIILISTITSSVCAAVTPQMRLSVAEGRLDECSRLYQFAAKRMASVLIPMMCFFWVWSGEFISFVYSDKYLGAIWIFRIYLIYFLLRIVVTGQVFSSLGMGKFILTRSILTCVLNAAMNYVGIKLVGPIGAAIATVLSGLIIFVFSTAPMLKKKLGMRLRDTYPIKTTVCAMIIGLISGYAIELIFGKKLIAWLVGLLKLDSFLEPELAKTVSDALDVGVCALLFVALFGVLAMLFMRDDYEWIVKKISGIFSSVFKRSKKKEA